MRPVRASRSRTSASGRTPLVEVSVLPWITVNEVDRATASARGATALPARPLKGMATRADSPGVESARAGGWAATPRVPATMMTAIVEEKIGYITILAGYRAGFVITAEACI